MRGIEFPIRRLMRLPWSRCGWEDAGPFYTRSFFSFVATWLCSVDGFSCRCRPMVLPYIGSAKRQARVCPSQVLVDSRYGHERVQRGVVSGERKGRREGREGSRCDAVVLEAAVACKLRFNRVHFVSLLWSSPQVNVSGNEWTCSRVRAWGWHENVGRALVCQVLCRCGWAFACVWADWARLKEDCGGSAFIHCSPRLRSLSPVNKLRATYLFNGRVTVVSRVRCF